MWRLSTFVDSRWCRDAMHLCSMTFNGLILAVLVKAATVGLWREKKKEEYCEKIVSDISCLISSLSCPISAFLFHRWIICNGWSGGRVGRHLVKHRRFSYISCLISSLSCPISAFSWFSFSPLDYLQWLKRRSGWTSTASPALGNRTRCTVCRDRPSRPTNSLRTLYKSPSSCLLMCTHRNSDS